MPLISHTINFLYTPVACQNQQDFHNQRLRTQSMQLMG
ncbi:Uncharacterised protein [Vibrio cholerae]|nr:Uncharacterised protein [Vibrio cholerae]